MKKNLQIENYTTVAELVKLCNENGWNLDKTEVEVDAYNQPDSYGGTNLIKEIYLKYDE